MHIQCIHNKKYVEWLFDDNGSGRYGTAICPYCDIDSVIGESSGFPITNDKSLEELENDIWDKPGCKSYVVTTCFAARKKPLQELSNEEIRLLIGQKLGLKYLLPLAVDILKTDPLIEVTFYPGDLLK